MGSRRGGANPSLHTHTRRARRRRPGQVEIRRMASEGSIIFSLLPIRRAGPSLQPSPDATQGVPYGSGHHLAAIDPRTWLPLQPTPASQPRGSGAVGSRISPRRRQCAKWEAAAVVPRGELVEPPMCEMGCRYRRPQRRASRCLSSASAARQSPLSAWHACSFQASGGGCEG
jgi:hypothetical protein